MPARPALLMLCSVLLGACANAPGGDAQPLDTGGVTAAAAIGTLAPRARDPQASNLAPAPSAAADGHAATPAIALHQSDLQLYLGVMRAAAQRVRHPTTQDLDAIHATALWSQLMDTSSQMRAAPPAPIDEATLERSANLTGHMADLQVASERGIDLAHYQRIRDTIEGIATAASFASACNRDCGGSPGATATTVQARDRRLLIPELGEIRVLRTIVRGGKANATAP